MPLLMTMLAESLVDVTPQIFVTTHLYRLPIMPAPTGLMFSAALVAPLYGAVLLNVVHPDPAFSSH